MKLILKCCGAGMFTALLYAAAFPPDWSGHGLVAVFFLSACVSSFTWDFLK